MDIQSVKHSFLLIELDIHSVIYWSEMASLQCMTERDKILCVETKAFSENSHVHLPCSADLSSGKFCQPCIQLFSLVCLQGSK